MSTELLSRLAPLPYHVALVDHLRTREPGLWSWFSGSGFQTETAEKLRLELLRSTVRLSRETYGELYALADEVAKALGLEIPITLYQGQASSEPNASMFFVPGQLHLVFFGPLLERLDAAERRGVLAHEMAHHLLWERDGRQFLVAASLLDRATSASGEGSLHGAARTFHQLVEVFADRATALVCGDMEVAVRCLVKLETGLAVVSAKDYLAQAEELFGASEIVPAGISHPEAFIRVRALALWWSDPESAETKIEAMVKGPLSLDRLELLEQRELTAATMAMVQTLSAPQWMRSEAVLGHARLFSNEADPHDTLPLTPTPAHQRWFREPKLASYWGSVALDFALVDPQLGEPALAHAFTVAESYGFVAALEELAAKEAKMTKKAIAALRAKGPELLARAAQQEPGGAP